MAKRGLWIKMRCDLRDDTAVIALAADLGIPEEHAVGLLHKFWGWAKRQSSFGNLKRVTNVWVDGYVGYPGFCQSLVTEGWLVVENGQLQIPNWDAHLSAKADLRVLNAEKVAKHRAKSCTPKSVTNVTVSSGSGSGSDSDSTGVKKGSRKSGKGERANYSEAFELLWRRFPKREAKADSFAAWSTALKDGTAADEATLVSLIERYVDLPQIREHVQTGDVKYVAGLATVIRKRRWEDDPRTIAPTGRVLPKPGKYDNIEVLVD